jgi:hypothetical protein
MTRTRIIRAITIITLFMIILSCSDDKNIPKFKLSGRDDKFISVLVPENTSKEQIVNLIHEIRTAREENYLDKYFPPTTPYGQMGKYAIIGIYVFSDPDMATSVSLMKYLRGSEKNSSDVEFAKQYSNKVLGYYYFAVPDVEFGCIGLVDSGIEPTATYKKLFGTNYPW